MGYEVYVSTIRLKLSPVKHNFHAASHGLSSCTIRRDNRITIITIQINNVTIIIEVPP